LSKTFSNFFLLYKIFTRNQGRLISFYFLKLQHVENEQEKKNRQRFQAVNGDEDERRKGTFCLVVKQEKV